MVETHSVPFVSVIVPALDGTTSVRDCIYSLMNTDYPAAQREILVVGQGSTDGMADLVRTFSVRYLCEERRGVCYARNRGVEASGGSILAFTDPDCVVSRGWLRELVLAFEEESVGGVAGEVVPYPAITPAERYAARRRSHSQQRPLKHPVRPFAMLSNLAFRREVFERIGLLDTRFPGRGWEDADLCWRFSRGTGWKLAYAPRAVVFHRYRTSAKDFFIQHVRYGHGLGLIYSKYTGELGSGWRERVRALGDLGKAACSLTSSLLRHEVGRDKPGELDPAYFDLLRKLGQRLGFLGAAFSRVRFRSSTCRTESVSPVPVPTRE
ncbi:MAG: glycosyltransferase [Candidatus Methylomirabilis sp.]